MVDIKGFLETSFIDWPGKICSVVFLPGCNFRCGYCHNHGLVTDPERFASIPLEGVLERVQDLGEWIDGICITGGEPTLHDTLPRLIREIKRRGFPIKLDTNGSRPEMLKDLIDSGEVDYIAMDVKAPLDPFSYRRTAGCAVDMDAIMTSIRLLQAEKVAYEFRMTVVPALHRENDVTLVARQLMSGRRLVLQNFNPEDPLEPSLKNTRAYDPELFRRMQREVEAIA
jgi:pyruvate formate lyase activating enzyme